MAMRFSFSVMFYEHELTIGILLMPSGCIFTELLNRYLSVREIPYNWNIFERWVSKPVRGGRIPGVERFGQTWRSWRMRKNAGPRKVKE